MRQIVYNSHIKGIPFPGLPPINQWFEANCKFNPNRMEHVSTLIANLNEWHSREAKKGVDIPPPSPVALLEFFNFDPFRVCEINGQDMIFGVHLKFSEIYPKTT